MRTHLSVLGFLFWSAVVAPAAVESWPAFRGVNASGVSDTAKPPVKFGPAENVLWSIAVPGAPSSPCVWGDRIFLTAFEGGKLQTRGHDRRDGKLLWSRVAPAEKLEEFHATESSPATATPVTDGQRVVSYFGSCGLVAHDFSGKELWRHALPTAVTSGGFGSGVSPIIVGDMLVLNRDQMRGSSVLAVSLKTGKKIWETPRPEATTSYGSMVVWQNGGATEVVVSGSLVLKAYDPKTGAERWRVRGLPSAACTTPVVGDGMLFFAGWSPGKADSPWPSWESVLEKQDKNHDGVISLEEFTEQSDKAWFKAQDIDGDGKLTRSDWDFIGNMLKQGENAMLAIKPGGSGDITDTHVAWKFTRGLPYVPSPLFYQGRVYIVKDGGMATCVEAKTGQPFYTQERLNAAGSYYASPVAADGRIYVASLDGKVTVFKAGGDTPDVLHQVDFKERIAATPALVGNQLYLRTATKLYAFGK